MNNHTEITLTPDFANIFRQMLAEAVRQGDARTIFDSVLAPTQEAEALRAVQRWLAPLNIAAQCMTDRASVDTFRDALAKMATDLDRYAGALEAELPADGADCTGGKDL